MPEMLLHTMTLTHIGEQLDRAAMVLLALWRIMVGDEMDEFWTTIGDLSSWNFHVGREGWRLFAKDLGVDPDWLVRSNHQGTFLMMFQDQLTALRPEEAEIQQLLESGDSGPLATPQDVAQQWHRLLDELDK
jgi:hypothetical protein